MIEPIASYDVVPFWAPSLAPCRSAIDVAPAILLPLTVTTAWVTS